LKSLVKNIFTTIVAITLLISITGFQVYKHTCAFHNFSAVSVIETPECEKDHQVFEETDDCCKAEEVKSEISCCETQQIDESNPYSFTSEEIKCCVSSIENSQIQDELFTFTEKKILIVESITLSDPFTEIEILQSKENLLLQNNNLPPPKFGKQLLQTIHQLKIDTPIC